MFEEIHADLGEIKGRNFLIMVDQFSGLPHVVPYVNKNTSASRVIDAARQFFSNPTVYDFGPMTALNLK